MIFDFCIANHRHLFSFRTSGMNLVMKSPLIKLFVQEMVFPLIDPPITNPIPFNNDGSVNILESLKIIVQNMDRRVIGYLFLFILFYFIFFFRGMIVFIFTVLSFFFSSSWSYDTGFKMLGNREVPSESVYHNEMFRVLQRWFGNKSWQLATNVRSKAMDGSAST